MADIDLLPQRGVPALALVDGTGIATNGTQTVAQLAARGMKAVCAVDGTGTSQSGATMLQLAQRGIRAFCPVDETGVASDSSTANQLRQRGIRPMVLLNNSGVALTGSATMATLAQRGLQSFCPVDEAGNATTMTDPNPRILRALTGSFLLAGDGMTPSAGYILSAGGATGANGFVITDPNTTKLTKVAVGGTYYAFAGSNNSTATGQNTVTQNVTVNLGTATATRRVIAFLTSGGGSGNTAIAVVSGVTLTQRFIDSASGETAILCDGIVPTGGTGVTLTVTWGIGASLDRDVLVWVADGLVTGYISSGGGWTNFPTAFAVNNGDFLFAAHRASTPGNYSTSTQPPANLRSSGTNTGGADWTTTANAAFQCFASSGGTNEVAFGLYR